MREGLERSGQVQRVRAFCRQTHRYERCLLYCGDGEATAGGGRPGAQQAAARKVQAEEGGELG